MTVTITRDELATLVVSTVRYALGRSTYVVSEVCDLVRRQWASLPRSTQFIVIRDISNAIALARRAGKQVGMAIDDDAWRALLVEIAPDALEGLAP